MADQITRTLLSLPRFLLPSFPSPRLTSAGRDPSVMREATCRQSRRGAVDSSHPKKRGPAVCRAKMPHDRMRLDMIHYDTQWYDTLRHDLIQDEG